jgi:competence protein ComFC
MNFKSITEGIKSLEELFFPSVCYFCGNELPNTVKVICRLCWCDLPRYSDENFEKYLPKQYRNLYILYRYDSIAGQLIHLLKYERRFSLAYEFAKALATSFPRIVKEPYHILLPVPLYKTRRRERGYNQCELVCKALSPLIGTRYETNFLVRMRNTKSQTYLDRNQRRENVENAFLCRQPVKNKHILLLDDVVTTGSTVNACSAALLNAGAKQVDVIILAG